MIIFPVRHHSPAAALQLERLIRERRPRAILVEGPADATPLVPLLLDPATVPPVALYAYRTGDDVRAAFYPFCEYSPEYAALKAGQEVGARLQFCDLPAAVTLTWDEREDTTDTRETPAGDGASGRASDASEDRAEADAAIAVGYGQFADGLVEASSFDSFEAFWEAAFEQEGDLRSSDGYVEVLTDYGHKVMLLSTRAHDTRDGVRERHMAAAVRAVIDGGVPSNGVLLVCGAAHAVAVAEAIRADAVAPTVDSSAEATIALIPFSFPRLSEQSGYGAGNRAPWYYQQIWDLRGDYSAATRRALVAVMGHLRRRGHTASLAQSIDAYNLSRVLAGMRGKVAPGVDELADAAIACFGQGHAAVVTSALQEVLIGEAVGRISHRVGRTPLQTEFYATADGLGLPVLDAPRQVLLHMPVPREAEQSIFLHRLAVANIPFARELESGLGGRGRVGSASTLEQIARVREKWELQWTPATDAQLIERTAWGSTFVEVCDRLLCKRLANASRIDDGTAVLLRMALCALTETFPSVLERCEALAADSASFPALARATYHLDGLLTYGAARKLPTDQLWDLAGRLFVRAVLHLPSAVVCGDEAAAEVEQTLTSLHDLVRRGSPVVADPGAFWDAVTTVAEMPGTHPSPRGLALVLLELEGRLPPGELATRLRYWLSTTAEAADNARLVAGLFSLHRGTLVRNRALIGAVTEFLLDLEVEQLTPLLPVLRRSLGRMGAAERTYLSETLAAVLGSEAGRALRLTSDDEALLREADAAVAAVLSEWRDRYGIE